MNPFRGLLRSRKFWIGVVDAFVSTVAVLVTLWLSPEDVKTVLTVVGIWQPVVIAIIAGIAYEDGQMKRAGGGGV